uniref:Ig-like domain-containing protein n=1 Tax=Kryptolebias marmoratus TaxID=37003 RepID=A0A3Q3GNM8_KRYMA
MLHDLFIFADALVPVVTVQLGEPATLTCDLPDEWLGLKSLHWYKQDAGNSLKLITMLRKNTNPKYGPGVSPSRFNVTYYEKISSLTVLGTVKEDEGMYHCAVIILTHIPKFALYSEGNDERTINFMVIQQPTLTGPVRVGDSVTLECSVLYENKTCGQEPKVFWFRPGSHQSHPEMIYTDDCKKKHDRRCVYSFSKKVTSSDVGTYYCAVATCEEIIFGNGLNLQIGTFVFNFLVKYNAIIFQCHHELKSHFLFDGDDNDLNYAALHLSGGRATRGNKKNELKMEESVYSQVKR